MAATTAASSAPANDAGEGSDSNMLSMLIGLVVVRRPDLADCG